MAVKGPVKIRQGKIDDLLTVYKNTYRKISEEIVTATESGKIQRARVLARIDAELQGLGTAAADYVKGEIPQYYLDGVNQAQQDLKRLGVKTTKAPINREAIGALTQEVTFSMDQSIQSLKRGAAKALTSAEKRQINFTIAEGKLSGDARKTITAAVKQELQDQGIAALVDKAGREWSFDTYAEMLVRTKAVEARNQGLANRMLEDGYDLVEVSDHNSEHQACAEWEGKILSVSGNTPAGTVLPGDIEVAGSLEDAIAAGLFHPNCEHAINVFNAELAAKTEAYDNPYNHLDPEQREAADQAFADRNKSLSARAEGDRPGNTEQKAMEAALNRGDIAAAQEVIDNVKDDDLRSGLQSTIDSLVGTKHPGFEPSTGKGPIQNIPVYHGTGTNGAITEGTDIFGEAFYVARDKETAGKFGEVSKATLSIRPSQMLTIRNEADHEKLINASIRAFPGESQKAIPQYVQSLGYKAVEGTSAFDPLAGIAVYDKKLVR